MITATSLFFVLLGAYNWLIVGIAKYDIIAAIFYGSNTIGARVVYILIGLCALWLSYVAIFRRDVISYKNDLKMPAMKRNNKTDANTGV